MNKNSFPSSFGNPCNHYEPNTLACTDFRHTGMIEKNSKAQWY